MVRPAQFSDLNAVLTILAEVLPLMQHIGNHQWSAAYPNRARFEKDLAANTLFVCETAQFVAGFIVLNHEFPPEYDTVSWESQKCPMALHRMAVSPRYQGRGHAREMIRYCENAAIDQGSRCIHTDTNSKNIPVNHLFRQLGYRFCGKITLRANPDLFHCYEKSL